MLFNITRDLYVPPNLETVLRKGHAKWHSVFAFTAMPSKGVFKAVYEIRVDYSFDYTDRDLIKAEILGCKLSKNTITKSVKYGNNKSIFINLEVESILPELDKLTEKGYDNQMPKEESVH